MKKIIVAILVIVCIGTFACYHCFGWFEGDVLEYLQENCNPEGKEILTGEYLSMGKDEQGEYILYQVQTEDQMSYYVRVKVVFHKYLTKTGPDFKIKDLHIVEDVDLIVKE